MHHRLVHGEAQLADERVAAYIADELRRMLYPHVTQVRRPLAIKSEINKYIHGLNVDPYIHGK